MWLGLQASSWLKKVHSNVILQFCPDTGLCPNHPSKSYPLWYVMPNSKHCKNLEISHHTIRTKQKQSPCTYIFRRSWWLAWSMIQFIPSKSLHPLLIVHELHTKSDCSESDRLTRYSTILNDYVWNHSTIIKFFKKVHQLDFRLDTTNVTFMALSAIWHDRLKYVKPIFAL